MPFVIWGANYQSVMEPEAWRETRMGILMSLTPRPAGVEKPRHPCPGIVKASRCTNTRQKSRVAHGCCVFVERIRDCEREVAKTDRLILEATETDLLLPRRMEIPVGIPGVGNDLPQILAAS